ncbi:MAG: class I SAM-dependent methyltransferase, partial [Myxococcales bacterium]|nr:class I SAM-dependent methyltransferase [Myxococcales bacterium]
MTRTRPTAGGAQEPVLVGNLYDKYGTRNPFARALMRRFLGAVSDLYARVNPETVLEIGCGEGHLAQHLVTRAARPARFVACDVDLRALRPDLDPLIETRQASAYELPFGRGEFDLVVCCEVLEHLQAPERALAEATRIARRAVLLSTPREPIWRVLNVARGRYLRRMGDTPGHVQHFSRRALTALASESLHILECRTPPPWTVLLGAPIGRGPSVSGRPG